jgi:hypothetical protein
VTATQPSQDHAQAADNSCSFPDTDLTVRSAMLLACVGGDAGLSVQFRSPVFTRLLRVPVDNAGAAVSGARGGGVTVSRQGCLLFTVPGIESFCPMHETVDCSERLAFSNSFSSQPLTLSERLLVLSAPYGRPRQLEPERPCKHGAAVLWRLSRHCIAWWACGWQRARPLGSVQVLTCCSLCSLTFDLLLDLIGQASRC